MTDRPRLFYLDNLRAFVIVMVIVLHASITYMAASPRSGGTSWTRTGARSSRGSCSWSTCRTCPPSSSWPATSRSPRSSGAGWTGSSARRSCASAIPWIFAVIFLAPLVTYMIYVSRDNPMGYLEFWTTDFWGPMFQQAVYWFLGVLMALFLLLAWVYAASTRLQASVPRVEQPRGAPLRGLHRPDRGGFDPLRAGLRPRRLAALRVVPGRAAGADRVLRRVLRPRDLRGTARLVQRPPASGRTLGRGAGAAC